MLRLVAAAVICVPGVLVGAMVGHAVDSLMLACAVANLVLLVTCSIARKGEP